MKKLILLFLGNLSFAEANENVTNASDIIQILLPSIAGVSTFFVGDYEDGGLIDKEGLKQFGISFGGNVVTTQLGKFIFGKVRPESETIFLNVG